ncbi:MAG: hypothetical protein QF535_05905, partial [Anaerolineales bacterium]|nr:hypothetical protein [Anaerolineales bacterium]
MRTIIEEYDGHIIYGVSRYTCGQTRNNYRLIKDGSDQYYEMNVGPSLWFKFDSISLDGILHMINPVTDEEFTPTWFITKVGYVACKVPGRNNLYLHQYLMNHYNNGKGKISIDHINRD